MLLNEIFKNRSRSSNIATIILDGKTGERIMFEDNAVALLKDDKGNPKGTQIKGPVAKEVAERWKAVGKIAQFVL